MLIDTHAHLTMPEFPDIEQTAESALNSSVSKIINVGFDLDSSRGSVRLSAKFPMMYSCVGIHPHHACDLNEEAIEELRAMLSDPKTVAVGETGLDYYRSETPADRQKDAFRKHIRLAKSSGKPLVIHGRQSSEDTLSILTEGDSEGVKAVFHCFSEGKGFAAKVLNKGFMISFTGVITFKNAHESREVVKYVPLESMMLETDCPYLAPQVFRGKRNEPAYLRFIAEKVAELKGKTLEEVSSVTTSNAERFFGI